MTRLSAATADLFVDRQNDIVCATHPVDEGQPGKNSDRPCTHTAFCAFGALRSGKTVVFLVRKYVSVMSSENQQKPKALPPSSPRHVAIIMDGNGRWAKSRGNYVSSVTKPASSRSAAR
ncbi:hypothetical protein SODG_001377 [Sodalis praecaptivus]